MSATVAREACTLKTAPKFLAGLFFRTQTLNAHFSAWWTSASCPMIFATRSRGIKMDGPCAKVNFVLSEEPRVNGMPLDFNASQRSLFTLVPSLEFAERCYDIAKFGEIPEELWVDCVVASNVDSTLAPPGRHIMTCFVQFVPYKLRHGTWDENRELLGDRVVKKIAEYAPERPELDRRAASSHPARSGTHLRPYRGQYFSRRSFAGAAFLHAPGAGLGAVSHANRRTYLVWRRRASRRWSDRRARLQRGPSRAPRFANAGRSNRSMSGRGECSEKANDRKKGFSIGYPKGSFWAMAATLLELEKRGCVRAGPFTPEVALNDPEALLELHHEFREAGAEVLQALTFYASRDKLATVGLENNVEELNCAAVRIARASGRRQLPGRGQLEPYLDV